MAPSKSTKDRPNHGTMLSDDIFYYLAKEGIQETQVISRLSQTCRRLSKLLDPLLYRADVLKTKQSRNEGHPRYYWPWYRDVDTPRPAEKTSALHWAADHRDKRLGLEVARKSIKAALKHWPPYLQLTTGEWEEMTSGMTPLHLAAMSGNEEIVQELISASSIVDKRVWLNINCRNSAGVSFLSRTTRSLVCKQFGDAFGMNPLGLAILFGHLHIAEALARVTQYFTEEPDTVEEDWVGGGHLKSLKLAILHKMPSVVRILQTRGYIDFGDSELLPIAAANDGNEEMLQLLIDGARDAEEVNTMGAYKSALNGYCVSNLLFLAGCHLPGSGPLLFFKFITKFMQTDEYLPVVKELLEEDPETCHAISLDLELHLRKFMGRDFYHNRGIMIEDYLLHHPNIEFSEEFLPILLKDHERRREHRERLERLPEDEQEKLIMAEEESNWARGLFDYRLYYAKMDRN